MVRWSDGQMVRWSDGQMVRWCTLSTMARADQNTSLLIKRGIRRGLATLIRERQYGVALLSLFGVLLLSQMLLLVLLGIQTLSGTLQSQLDLRLALRSGAAEQSVHNFIGALRAQPDVEEVTFVTKEQAYERERVQNPDLVSFLEKFSIKNPFPDTITVRLTSLERYNAFAAFVRQPAWKDTVDAGFLSQAATQQQSAHRMIGFVETARTLTLGFLAVLFFVLLFTVVELLRRRAIERRDELLVERLAGAPPLATLMPFITEAMVLLCVSLLFSIIGIWAMMHFLPGLVPSFQTGALSVLRFRTNEMLGLFVPLIVIGEMIVLGLLACAGAWLGVRKLSW